MINCNVIDLWQRTLYTASSYFIKPTLTLNFKTHFDVTGKRGKDTHVYVIDTGVKATHNEFSDRIGDGFDVNNEQSKERPGVVCIIFHFSYLLLLYTSFTGTIPATLRSNQMKAGLISRIFCTESQGSIIVDVRPLSGGNTTHWWRVQCQIWR